MSAPITPFTPAAPPSQPRETARNDALWQAAQSLEASFLAEMLAHAGFGAARDSFGGGAGEEQFASMLQAEHARALVARGGIGLAQSLYAALVARGDQDRGDGP